ncbi:beta-2-microglobulin-like isoform X1 [Trematomus bernacchii]|uniref:beta-2-microglobulin-like isoform X1 n=1 Tax=Trematomus bernacchii TaxID=40690 RepID=UPI001469AEA8|nr:beta-2-microglobulin-like isoform X1 [Trematomus bernacchii]
MKICLAVLVGLLSVLPSKAKDAAADVQVYSRAPGIIGKPNTLICHVKGFYPPEISIQVLKNGKDIPGAKQTDLAFEANWHYHLTKHVPFTPSQDDKYTCLVNHLGSSREFTWVSDM